MNDVLMSITPAAGAAFLLGTKTAELRRRALKLATGTRVWLYVKRPVARVCIVGRVDEVIEGAPRLLWQQYRHELSGTRADFNAYLHGSDKGCVMRLRGVRGIAVGVLLDELRDLEPGFHPPQVYRRLDGGRLLQRLQSSL